VARAAGKVESGVAFRGELQSAETALAAAKSNPDHIGGPERDTLAGLVRALNEKIERVPQLSQVRPAAIALHNLAVSLSAADAGSTTLIEELDAALDGVRSLLDEPTFGFSPEELRSKIDDALLAKGVTECLACKNANLAIEVAYHLVRPYPSEPSLPPSQIPSAVVVCTRCGCTWSHDLRMLGVL
jgi:hypothetical protein